MHSWWFLCLCPRICGVLCFAAVKLIHYIVKCLWLVQLEGRQREGSVCRRAASSCIVCLIQSIPASRNWSHLWVGCGLPRSMAAQLQQRPWKRHVKRNCTRKLIKNVRGATKDQSVRSLDRKHLTQAQDWDAMHHNFRHGHPGIIRYAIISHSTSAYGLFWNSFNQ